MCVSEVLLVEDTKSQLVDVAGQLSNRKLTGLKSQRTQPPGHLLVSLCDATLILVPVEAQSRRALVAQACIAGGWTRPALAL